MALPGLLSTLLITEAVVSRITSGFGALNSNVAKTVELINPGQWVWLNRILLDLQGSVGHLISPMFDRIGVSLRTVADVLISLLPATDKFYTKTSGAFDKVLALGTTFGQTFVVVFESVFDLISEVIGELDPGKDTIQVLSDAIEWLGVITITVVNLIKENWKDLAKALSGDLDAMGQMAKRVFTFGLWGNDFTAAWDNARQRISDMRELNSSVGIGGRQASYTGFEEFGRQARISSYQLGRSPRRSIEEIGEDQLRELHKIEDAVRLQDIARASGYNTEQILTDSNVRQKIWGLKPPTDANAPL